MSRSASIEQRITGLFLNNLHIEVPSVETDLLATGALDSMGFVELLVRLEEAFGVEISLDNVEIDRFRSIRTIAEFILEQTRAGEGRAG